VIYARQVKAISSVCVNTEVPSPTLDEQLCGDNLHAVIVTRRYSSDGSRLTVDVSAIPSCERQTMSLFFPEGSSASQRKVGPVSSFMIPFGVGRRYCSLVVQNASRDIVFGRAVLLHPKNPLFVDSALLRSPIYVRGHAFEICDASFALELQLTSRDVRFVFQSERESVVLPVVGRGEYCRVCYGGLQEIHDGIWMICCTDNRHRFVAQVCIEIWQEPLI